MVVPTRVVVGFHDDDFDSPASIIFKRLLRPLENPQFAKRKTD
jgi:hypothetical protein